MVVSRTHRKKASLGFCLEYLNSRRLGMCKLLKALCISHHSQQDKNSS